MTYSTVREEAYASVTLRLLKSKTGACRGIILKKGAACSARSAETVPTRFGSA